MEKIKTYTIWFLFIACIILFLTRGCGTKIENNCETIHDTIIKHTVDTVWAEPKTITKVITKFKTPIVDTIIIDNTQHLVSTYIDSLVDDNLSITYKDQIEGKFISKSISYRLFVPKTIIKTKFMEITSTEYITKPPKFTIFVGGMVGGNKDKMAALEPIIGFTANKNAVFYGYNLMDQSHNIGFHTTIFKSKK